MDKNLPRADVAGQIYLRLSNHHMGPLRVLIARIRITPCGLITSSGIAIICAKRIGTTPAFKVQTLFFREKPLSFQPSLCSLFFLRPNCLIDFVTLYWMRNTQVC
jgi:hypothetical protein